MEESMKTLGENFAKIVDKAIETMLNRNSIDTKEAYTDTEKWEANFNLQGYELTNNSDGFELKHNGEIIDKLPIKYNMKTIVGD